MSAPITSDLEFITELVAKCLNVSPAALAAHIAAKREAARRSVERANRSYNAALSHITDVQAVVLMHLEADGHERTSQLWQDRVTQNVALMLRKTCWNGAKMRMSKKLVMLYPDGTMSQTFEKTISIRKSF